MEQSQSKIQYDWLLSNTISNILLQGKSSDKSNYIDCSQIPAGMYYMYVKDSSGRHTSTKIIITH